MQKMQPHNIINNTLRLALVAFAMLAACFSLHAAANVPTAIKPQGLGTTESPYLVTKVDEFLYINRELDKIYRQDADLDFSDIIFDNTVITKNFTGTYDGNGFAISNIKIDWSNKPTATSSTHFVNGIFLSVSGKIRNLVLDNIELKYDDSEFTDDKKQTYKPTGKDEICLEIGVLCGNAYNGAAIENIIIKNSKIEAKGDPNATNYFVGGLVGDVRSASGGSAAITAIIKNIYAQVDINLQNATRHIASVNDNAARPHQFQIGGIVGRLRTATKDYVPKNTMYEGTINAPIAMIGPCYGGIRTDGTGKGGDYFTKIYAGQVGSGNNILSSADDDKLRYFGQYEIYHCGSDSTTIIKEAVTGSYPTSTGCSYWTRTFSPNDSISSKTIDYTSAASMANYQGVNHGTYFDADKEPDRSEVLGMFNTYAASDENLNAWQYHQDWGFYYTAFSVTQPKYDTFVPVISCALKPEQRESYKIKWILSRNETDTDDEILRPITSDTLCISTDQDLKSNDILRYKKVKVELVNLADPNFKSESYEFEFPDIAANISRISPVTFIANIYDQRKESEYKLRWYKIEGGKKEFLGEIEGPIRESQYSFADETQLADAIGFEIYDINGNIYYYQNGTPAIVELPISNIDSETVKNYKVKISRKIIGKDTYYVARVYDGDGTMIAGGHPDDADYIANPLISYLWESTREVGDSHSYIPMSTNKSYTKGYATETYYKATGYYSGWPMSYAVLGDKDVIFVYDQDKHSERTAIANGTSSKNLITDFDGKDRWKENGEKHEADYPDGDDANDGRDPYHAVKTLQHAYELLDANNGPDDNIIVVMGFNYDPHFLDMNEDYDNIYNKAVTITGKRGSISGGAIVLSNNGTSPIGLRGATAFENLTLVAMNDPNYAIYTGLSLYLYCNLQDLTFGENIVMRRYKNLDAGTGTLDGTVAPDITIVGGAFNHNIQEGKLDSYITAKKGYKDEEFTTITIKSGCYGRIIGAARNTKKNTTSKNMFGNPTTPHRVRINIDLQHKDETAVLNEYWPDGSPSYDIGLLTGGQTDGTVYCEAEIEMNNGQIGRYISGNISFGRSADGGPSDSFFGSTIFTFRGGFIQELYGGSLGRARDGDGGVDVTTVQSYFYGRSIINIEGGTVNSDLNGAGAGGVAGVGTDLAHTDDTYIPYYNGSTLAYGKYEVAKGKVATMTLSGSIILDFAKTYNEINVRYGTVNGNIFGAGGGYSSQTSVSKASNLAGNLYGDCIIRISEDEPLQKTVINGSVYGAGAGSKGFYDAASGDDEKNKFKALAQLYGNCEVEISGGTIAGDVFAGARGIEGFPDMAATYGNTNLSITGGTILGNIYGGSGLANIRRFELSKAEALDLSEDKYFTETTDSTHYYLKDSGHTHVNISGGIIGNCIFGGSMGCEAAEGVEATKAMIDGNTYVTITGGDFIDTPYIDMAMTDEIAADSLIDGKHINVVDHPQVYRNFNIYGGGNVNCDINGTAYVRVTSSLLNSEYSFMPKEQNPNALTSHDKSERFQSAYMDITYRRFCVYGAGYGELTNVLNTDVYVCIPPERMGVTLPHGNTLTSYLPHQSFFDIAGGGYSGDVGYWATADGARSRGVDKKDMSAAQVAALYHHYVGGRCKVTIDGYTYARKIIGGGFYGSCRSTNTHVLCGSLRQVYGGSLLGYVHDKALLQFGNRIEDFIRNVGGSYVYDEAGCFGAYEGDEYLEYEGDKANVEPEVWAQAEARAKQLNDYIFITEDIYGGNDVKGIIGTQLYQDELTKEYAIDATDGGPLFQTDVTKTEEKGIVFNIYGGTFMDNVYSAGNGHYRGYYVPEWVRYNDGPARMYRMVKSSTDNTKTARAYRSRPMVGSVNVNLRGNSKDDYVKLHKDFFGGGSECTIGQFNTILPLEDPRRMVQGGHLHVNFGGYVQIDGNVYMGAEGRTIGQQLTVPDSIDIATFNGSTTAALATLGEVAYGHWYHNGSNYVPGFPAAGKVDANFNMTGQHMFDSYMQNVQMQGDIETTFYRNLYERDPATGKFVYWKDPADSSKDFIDATGQRIRTRKHWSPGELATKTQYDASDEGDRKYAYDAQGITMNSFYLGGLSGTMTNNNLMVYDYDNHRDVAEGTSTGTDLEKWGSIYRVTLPAGVTVRDKVVMGSENATIDYYPYNADYTIDYSVDPVYTYEGGLTTQNTYSFDLIVYNDKVLHGANIVHRLPSDFYDEDNYRDIKAMTSYKLANGKDAGTTIHRKTYNHEDVPTLNAAVGDNPGRFSLATTDEWHTTAYVGPREKRQENKGTGIGNNAKTVTKLTVACQFDPLSDDNSTGDDDHAHHYGGNIYGGCYRSGIVVGNVVMNIGSNLLGSHFDEIDASTFGEISSLKYNIGRVFGGGFGENTRIEGDTYVNLLKNFRGMNVFGGGMQGDVTGTAHVVYIGAEDKSYVFGNIYGGGLMGSVGTAKYLADGTTLNPERTIKATDVRLYSGNVDNVYGGSCMGNLYGRSYVELCDQVQSELDHLDHKRMKFDWGHSRLIAGTVFGGNDISGNIYYDYDSSVDSDAKFGGYSTGVYVHEVQEQKASGGSSAMSQDPVGPGKTSPGSVNGYNGFPLIGDLYGGGNGDYGKQRNDSYYASGEVIFATGDSTNLQPVLLDMLPTPNATTTHICLEGGTIINAYGGADMSTVTDKVLVSVNYPEKSLEARAGFESSDELTRVWNVLHFSSDELMNEVTSEIDYKPEGQSTAVKSPIFTFPIFRLFGANNNADMAIQPSWALTRGVVGSLYSGGNFGRMTYYNPNADTTKGETKGLTLTIDSPDMHIDYVYGGARVGDIMPLQFISAVLDANNVETPAHYALPSAPGDDFYGATLNIHQGIIEHVYGGNDVAGYVHFGTNVNIYGAISGDVYCAGNGNYLYKYDRKGDQMDYRDEQHARIQEHYEFETAEYKGARYFLLPAKSDYGTGFDPATLDDQGHATDYAATDAQTIMAINSYRPNVERTKMNITGSSAKTVWVKGNVYCGGNSSTVVSQSEGSVEFEIGSHVVLNGVFLGSNGESLADGQMIQYIEKLNAMDGVKLDMTKGNNLKAGEIPTKDASALGKDPQKYEYPKVLDLYMRAVEITEKPKNFDFGDITEAYIGDFVIGGNRGSMLTDKKIELHFPKTLTIYNRIIGGCKDANVEYNGVTHHGGLTQALAEDQDGVKIKFDIKSVFRPLGLRYPNADQTPPHLSERIYGQRRG